jgi:lipopolysaccharide export system permease protein
MTIELYDGEIHEMPDPQHPQKYQVIRFKQHKIRLSDMKRDIEDSKRQTRSDREMNLTSLLRAAHDERRHIGEAAAQVASVQSGIVDQQWELLDATEHPANPAGRPLNPAERLARLMATRRRVEQATSQASAQSRIRESYVRKENKYLVEFHKKIAVPFACLVFTLLGVPMAVTTSRSGRGVSITLALTVYLIYYLCIVGGEKLSDRGLLDPAIAMWAGNILLVAAGIPLFLRAVRETTIWTPRAPRWLHLGPLTSNRTS